MQGLYNRYIEFLHRNRSDCARAGRFCHEKDTPGRRIEVRASVGSLRFHFGFTSMFKRWLPPSDTWRATRTSRQAFSPTSLGPMISIKLKKRVTARIGSTKAPMICQRHLVVVMAEVEAPLSSIGFGKAFTSCNKLRLRFVCKKMLLKYCLTSKV